MHPRPQYVGVARNVRVQRGRPTRIEIQLHPPGDLSGAVRTARGEPAAAAKVYLALGRGQASGYDRGRPVGVVMAVADDQGRFRFPRLPAEPHYLWAGRLEADDEEKTVVEIEPDKTVHVNLTPLPPKKPAAGENGDGAERDARALQRAAGRRY